MWVRTAGAAAGIVVLVGVGVIIGRATATTPAPPPTLLQADNDTDDGPPAPGTREAVGSDAATGARLHVVVTPANGWLGIEVESATVPNGTRCRLFAYDRAGKGYEFGGWVQSAKPDFPIYGAVLLAPADLASVAIVNDSGAKVVTAEIPAA
jgi:RNA polymerase sigma-70 factor (ECF subfamily)